MRPRLYGLQFLVVLGTGGLVVFLVGLLHGLGSFLAMFAALAAAGAITAVTAAAMPADRSEAPAPASADLRGARRTP